MCSYLGKQRYVILQLVNKKISRNRSGKQVCSFLNLMTEVACFSSCALFTPRNEVLLLIVPQCPRTQTNIFAVLCNINIWIINDCPPKNCGHWDHYEMLDCKQHCSILNRYYLVASFWDFPLNQRAYRAT